MVLKIISSNFFRASPALSLIFEAYFRGLFFRLTFWIYLAISRPNRAFMERLRFFIVILARFLLPISHRHALPHGF
jgi:hypothetical protein